MEKKGSDLFEISQANQLLTPPFVRNSLSFAQLDRFLLIGCQLNCGGSGKNWRLLASLRKHFSSH